MKTRGKVLLATLSAAMLVTASVMGTLAYLQDSETVTNTFTVGNVGLTLTETAVDENGDPTGASDITHGGTQSYKLMPGHDYTKDPTVTVNDGSEDAYVRMMTTITYDEAADAVFAKYGIDNWINIDAENWKVNGAPETTRADGKISRTYEFRYATVVTEPGELPSLFTEVTVPDDVTNEELANLNGMTIAVEAHAIQEDGFADADAAWEAFK